MGSSLYLFMLMHLFLLLSFFHLTVLTNFSSSKQPLLCHHDESSALMQFKLSFSLNKSAPSSYSKVESWKLEGERSDCCSWDGVECDEDTGHVITLDLSSSFLYGSINSNSSLFSLVHLQRLNLADNYFNDSHIPSGILRLLELTSLNLSGSRFTGQIPLEISQLTQLCTLDLSINQLKLLRPSLKTLVQNLTGLEELWLSQVDISSTIPDTVANLSSLTYLVLRDCGLHGEFPTAIFHTPKLQVLSVRSNKNLTGYLPEFHRNSPLKYLRLDGTNFSGKLPDSIGNLNSLNWLNLSECSFTGSLPASLSNLTQLTTLSLGSNYFSGKLPDSIGNLKSLNWLDLSKCSFTGSFPASLSNLTQLTTLSLGFNDFSGKLPDSIGNLKSLSWLYLGECSFSGYLPASLSNLTQLTTLSLGFNDFSGKLPDSIGNLKSLNWLDLSKCSFTGSFPASLSNLTQLTTLSLGFNDFSGKLPDSIGNLKSLSWLYLGECSFSGYLPASLSNLTQLTTLGLNTNNVTGNIPSLASLSQLTYLNLGYNQFTGQIPSFLMNLTRLIWIDLSGNQLQGPIPSSFSELKNLKYLRLLFNNFSGTLNLDTFSKNTKLNYLALSGNSISLLTNITTNAIIPKFEVLALGSCNLTEFPDFLRFQDRLTWLDLYKNKIHGQIPEWMWNISKDTLEEIDLSHNLLTSFGHHPIILPWAHLRILDLSYNMLQGSLPIPPPNAFSYKVSNNNLAGEIPPLICGISSLYILDLSNNNLSGTIPSCLGNFSNSLLVMNLKGNNFRGTIPQTYIEGNNLRMIDLSQNQLEGQLPRSLANCTGLEILDLGGNWIDDGFPFWLGALSGLQVLILRSNNFHGTVGSPTTNVGFRKLQIIDLSNNSFIGNLPLEYFQNLNFMKNVNEDWLSYMRANFTFKVNPAPWSCYYEYSITITTKGVIQAYKVIKDIFTVVDLSSNKFRGEISQSIGNLKGLQLLNLSNNRLTGCIPPSLSKLTKLESLDLSKNELSGEIPPQLVLLTFLAFLNVSYNHLTGPIPRGDQFSTFENNSFKGNSELCGEPLSKKCGNQGLPTPQPVLTIEESDDSKFPSGVDWIVIFMGFGIGLVVGLIIGQSLTTRYHEWFVKKFGNW